MYVHSQNSFWTYFVKLRGTTPVSKYLLLVYDFSNRTLYLDVGEQTNISLERFRKELTFIEPGWRSP